jgi:hypothetical protein
MHRSRCSRRSRGSVKIDRSRRDGGLGECLFGLGGEGPPGERSLADVVASIVKVAEADAAALIQKMGLNVMSGDAGCFARQKPPTKLVQLTMARVVFAGFRR